MTKRERIVVFTGSGVSSPSGLATFRDPDGIWSKYNIEEVATPEAWRLNPAKVLEFYNLRRSQLGEVRPNGAHLELAGLESDYDVVIITQNVDNLHERAGSSSVIHLHGELTKVKSEKPPEEILDVGYSQINIGDTDSQGIQLRPNVVWFGEQVENLDLAVSHFGDADIVIVAGTSLTVYPAASLVHDTRKDCRKYLIDLNAVAAPEGFTLLQGSADTELEKLTRQLRDKK